MKHTVGIYVDRGQSTGPIDEWQPENSVQKNIKGLGVRADPARVPKQTKVLKVNIYLGF